MCFRWETQWWMKTYSFWLNINFGRNFHIHHVLIVLLDIKLNLEIMVASKRDMEQWKYQLLENVIYFWKGMNVQLWVLSKRCYLLPSLYQMHQSASEENTLRSGAWFNIKMLSYQCRKSHSRDKTVVRSSYLHDEIFFTGKMESWYWSKSLHSGKLENNSLRPSDTIWRHRSGSTLAQVMAYFLMAPSHYLNQCWLIISKVLWHSSEDHFLRDTLATIH